MKNHNIERLSALINIDLVDVEA